MYFDNLPCTVCGADIELRAHDASEVRSEKNPDGTVDLRVCTNPDCPTNTSTDADAPTP
ncbi:hypothetical protein NSZ01_28730 [Nocardioides szechwanensis]|uniref:Uncharacterized protein n=1 Tax=Nocardioides szechwanensis TaxID=1005944 RepID=A0A1H0JEK1_9ACTN|nr:hypothetical protein [Nocardioides szechwanensis]GEP35105.1 hypothetical protein NSZ01_28730 [Nocardioides szechwanensis]SDO42178.1 hypothetical protein SAMN05192576_4005 [Nocardioides szechwanensis]